MEGHWDLNCHSTIRWDKIDEKEDIHLVSQSKEGSWNLVVDHLIGNSISPDTIIAQTDNFATIVSALLQAAALYWVQTNNRGSGEITVEITDSTEERYTKITTDDPDMDSELFEDSDEIHQDETNNGDGDEPERSENETTKELDFSIPTDDPDMVSASLVNSVEIISGVENQIKDDVINDLSNKLEAREQMGRNDRSGNKEYNRSEVIERVIETVKEMKETEVGAEYLDAHADIFDLLENSTLFVGTRRRDRDYPEILSPRDIASAAVLIGTFIQSNVVTTGETPKSQYSDAQPVDFRNNLVSFGGPIPNDYTRNLMYSGDIEYPYRYYLNPEPEIIDLSSYSPAELRKLGKSDKEEFNRPPNWYIADATGEPARIGGEKTLPVSDGDRWVKDYFMISKTPNIHPQAKQGTKCLMISGCHELGTLGATRSIQIQDNVLKIHDEVEGGYFQAIGRFKRNVSYRADGTVKFDYQDPEILEVVEL